MFYIFSRAERFRSFSTIESKELKEILRSRVELFLARHEGDYVEDVFRRHATISFEGAQTKGEDLVSPSQLQACLRDMGILLDLTEVEALAQSVIGIEKVGLNLAEFRKVLREPPSKLEIWAETLPLSGMLASCLDVHAANSDDKLRSFSLLSTETIDAAADAFCQSLRVLLKKAQAKMSSLYQDPDAANKKINVATAAHFTVYKLDDGTLITVILQVSPVHDCPLYVHYSWLITSAYSCRMENLERERRNCISPNSATSWPTYDANYTQLLSP